VLHLFEQSKRCKESGLIPIHRRRQSAKAGNGMKKYKFKAKIEAGDGVGVSPP